jgi:hypothetical protein
LDPPAEFNCEGARYKTEYRPIIVNSIPSGKIINIGKQRKDFSGTGRFNRAFVGSRSVAGNQLLAKTAQESYKLDFGSWVDFGNEHKWVVENFEKMTARIEDGGLRLYQNKLSLQNLENNSFDNYKDCIIWTNYCHEGVLIVAPPNQMKNLTTFKNGTQLIFN